MQKSDIVIAAIGVVAIVATVLGVLWEDTEQTYTFPERSMDVEEATAELSGPVDFTYDTPDNATGAMFEVQVDFNGQAVQGGDADVELVLTAPDGTETSVQGSLAIPPFAGSASATFTINATWDQAPDDRTTDSGEKPAAMMWEDPIVLRVTVRPPADTPPLSRYSFEGTVHGSITYYEASAELPDAENIQ